MVKFFSKFVGMYPAKSTWTLEFVRDFSSWIGVIVSLRSSEAMDAFEFCAVNISSTSSSSQQSGWNVSRTNGNICDGPSRESQKFHFLVHGSRLFLFKHRKKMSLEKIESFIATDLGELYMEKFIGHSGTRKNPKKWKFRVRWGGYELEDDTLLDWTAIKGLATAY